VRLHPLGSDGVLGVAEGIETALSARILHNVPVWATLNAQMLEQFVPPVGCKKLLIFGDNDESCTGQAASWALAKKCAIKFKIKAEVHIPLRSGKDYNDVLLRGA
jgi:putative DNA primase/helicase